MTNIQIQEEITEDSLSLADLASVNHEAMLVEQANTTIANIGASMDAIADVSKSNIMYVNVFRTYWLNFLAPHPDAEPMSTGERRHLLDKWMEFAGGPYNEVNLIDDTGEVVLVVPRLFTRPNINFNSDEFYENIASYELKKNRLAVDGDRYLTNVMNNLPINVKLNKFTDDIKWKKIYDYFYKDSADDVPAVEDKQEEDNDVSFLDI